MHIPILEMVDYSKWDSFGDGDDESDSDAASHLPQVTTFEGERGRSFVIGPSGVNLVASLPTHPPPKKDISFALNCQNGGETSSFTWSQDRNEVRVCKIVASDLKASNVKIDFNASNDTLAVSEICPYRLIFEGMLRYKFEIDCDGLCPIQWELVKSPADPAVCHEQKGDNRILEIVFRKVSPIPGSVIWWKNVFLGDAEIDLTAIPGRGSASKEVATAWDEAHQLFRERIANRELIDINLNAEK